MPPQISNTSDIISDLKILARIQICPRLAISILLSAEVSNVVPLFFAWVKPSTIATRMHRNALPQLREKKTTGFEQVSRLN